MKSLTRNRGSAVNWGKNDIIKTTSSAVMKEREKEIGNCEVTPQAIWPVIKSHIKRDGPKAPTATRGPAGLKYQPLEKATTTANFSEIQFTPHDLCDDTRTRRVEA
jgi:hypothetical protein